MVSDLFLLLERGGLTMYILVAASIAAIGVLLERIYIYVAMQRAMARLGAEETPDAWFSAIVDEGYPADDDQADRHHEANTLRFSRALGARLAVLATIGGIAPFIGLFGTVIGIMHAFSEISRSRGTGIEVVGKGISEALVCTAAGLAVAIFAVVGYNLLRVWATRIEETLDLYYLQRTRKSAGGRQ